MNEILFKIIGCLLIVAASISAYMYLSKTNSESKDEVHVHSDLLLYVNGSKVDLTGDEFQSKAGHTLHDDIHLHDNNDKVVHRHAEGITLGEFFYSLGFTLDENCLAYPNGEQYCTDETNNLVVLNKGNQVQDFPQYINQEEDQLLVLYGNLSTTDLQELELQVTTDACIYSGTCPEKGTPPPESCGLTCDV